MPQEQSVAVSYKVMKGEKEYLKIIAANIVNRFGDSIDAVAFGWMVYQLTGSREWLAVIMGVNMLPTMLLQPFAGAWVNYLNKKLVMVCCDVGRGLLVLTIAFSYWAGSLTPVMLLVITILNSSLEALRQPCGMAVAPLIVKRENFTVASSLNQSVSRASELIGMGISGVIIATLGVGGAIAIDAITFFVSAFILAFLRLPPTVTRTEGNYFRELRDGFGYFIKCRAILMITLICVLLTFFEFPADYLRAAYISESLMMGEGALSVSSAMLSLGMFLGTALFPQVFGRSSGFKVCIVSGLFTGVFYLALVGITPIASPAIKLALYGLLILVYGHCMTSVNMAIGVAIFQNVEPDFMARVGSLFNAIACASSPVAALFVSALVGLVPLTTFYLCTGVVTLVVIAVLSRSRTLRSLK